MKKTDRVGVIGHGSWGTAIVKMLCENLESVHWWVRSEEVKSFIRTEKHNPRSLTAVTFDTQTVQITTSAKELFANCDWVVIAVPSIYVDRVLRKETINLEGKKIISAVKGIVPETLQVLGEYLHEHHKMNWNDFLAIGGPCHAEEVAMERLSYLTIASEIKANAKQFASFLNSDYIYTTTNKDTLGVEYAAVLKNIYAIAAGMAHGLGYGDNFQAILMSNAVREMNRFVKELSTKESRKINDSAYLGDLLVTGYSFFSRNRMFGNMIGKGYTVKSAIMEMQMIAEGYYATKAIYDMRTEKDVKTPIVSAVYKVLYKEKPVNTVFRELTKKLD